MYSFFIVRFNINATVCQNQEIQNIAIINKYLFSQKPVGVVILGSSMSARLPTSQSADYIYNMGLGGESALVGLEIVSRQKVIPRIILIETNMLYVRKNKDLINNVLGTRSYLLKKNLVILREENQPVNLLLSCMKHSKAKDDSRSDTQLDAAVLQKIVNQARRNVLIHYKETMFKSNLNRTKEIIDALQSRGSTCIFFTLPIDNELAILDVNVNMCRIFLEYFPEKKYLHVTNDGKQQYMTTDGVHMTPKASSMYLDYICRQLSNIYAIYDGDKSI